MHHSAPPGKFGAGATPRGRLSGLGALFALLFCCLSGISIQAQVPGAVKVVDPLELPNPPRRPVQLGGYAMTIDKAVDWLFRQNPDLQTAQESLRRARETRASNAAIDKAERDMAEIARRRLLELKRAFYESVLERLLIYEAQENLTYFDNYINRWQARYEEGIAPESEAAKWRLERARVTDAMAELKLAERRARIRFFALLGGANSTNFGELFIYLEEAPAQPMARTPDELVDAGLRRRRPAESGAALKAEIQQEVEAAYAAAETHRERAVAIKAQQLSQSEYLRGVAASYYNENEAPLIALLDAQRTRWEVRQKYWRALADYHISLAELEAAAGQPLKEITP
ncbi:MAG: hypothetical protein SF339_23995 [Blastocatellia bacterium]|nr:hypothetical protein [Blastocatellia bacterium]